MIKGRPPSVRYGLADAAKRAEKQLAIATEAGKEAQKQLARAANASELCRSGDRS